MYIIDISTNSLIFVRRSLRQSVPRAAVAMAANDSWCVGGLWGRSESSLPVVLSLEWLISLKYSVSWGCNKDLISFCDTKSTGGCIWSIVCYLWTYDDGTLQMCTRCVIVLFRKTGRFGLVSGISPTNKKAKPWCSRNTLNSTRQEVGALIYPVYFRWQTNSDG